MAILVNGTMCQSELTIGEEVGIQLEALVSNSSNVLTIPPCCIDCKTPIIVNNVYDGYSYIAFSLDMPDGTKVKELTYGGTGVVFEGKGVIELNSPVVKGNYITLQVDDPNCGAMSCETLVIEEPESCDCPVSKPCHIRITNLTFEKTSDTNAKIKALDVESVGALQYRLNEGEWMDSWSEIGSFTLGDTNKLGIKMKNNPKCRMETVISVIEKIVPCPPCPPPPTAPPPSGSNPPPPSGSNPPPPSGSNPPPPSGGCTDTQWTDTGASRCENNAPEKEQVSNCGNKRWVANPGGGDCGGTPPSGGGGTPPSGGGGTPPSGGGGTPPSGGGGTPPSGGGGTPPSGPVPSTPLPSAPPTAPAPTAPAPSAVVCMNYTLQAQEGNSGSFSYSDCQSGNTITGGVQAGESMYICARQGTAVATGGGLIVTSNGVVCGGGTPPTAPPTAPAPTAPTTYYNIRRCGDDNNNVYQTDTVITQSGQRVFSGGGFYYVWIGTTTTTPTNNIGSVTIENGLFGCPST